MTTGICRDCDETLSRCSHGCMHRLVTGFERHRFVVDREFWWTKTRGLWLESVEGHQTIAAVYLLQVLGIKQNMKNQFDPGRYITPSHPMKARFTSAQLFDDAEGDLAGAVFDLHERSLISWARFFNDEPFLSDDMREAALIQVFNKAGIEVEFR